VPKLLAWNLRHGGGPGRMPQIALRLLEHAADVVVLTEFRRTTGGQIAGILADHGWIHQHSTEPPQGRNGVLVASRTPLDENSSELYPSAATATLCDPRNLLQQKLAYARLPVLGISLAAVHIPCDGRATGREAAFQAVVAAARTYREEPFLIMGDFNVGRHGLDESGATFTCTRLLGQLASLGYVDAWRNRHGPRREFSWYSHNGAGFRIDHAFASAALAPRLRDCRYSHAEREQGLSDHSALLLTLD
jgi:exodeoxyribonuclease III